LEKRRGGGLPSQSKARKGGTYDTRAKKNLRLYKKTKLQRKCGEIFLDLVKGERDSKKGGGQRTIWP